MVLSSHYAVPTSHVTVLSHIWWFSYFFSHLTVSSSHCAVSTSHMTVLSHIWWFPYFFLTFDGSIFTLCSSNITYDSFFLTFDGSLFFSHIWRFHRHTMRFQHNIWQSFCRIGWFPYFFLTLNDSILTLCNSNVTCRGGKWVGLGWT